MLQPSLSEQQTRFTNGLAITDLLGKRMCLFGCRQRLRAFLHCEQAPAQSSSRLPFVPFVSSLSRQRRRAFKRRSRFFQFAAQGAQLAERIQNHWYFSALLVRFGRDGQGW